MDQSIEGTPAGIDASELTRRDFIKSVAVGAGISTVFLALTGYELRPNTTNIPAGSQAPQPDYKRSTDSNP